jgi:hypothetical protein
MAINPFFSLFLKRNKRNDILLCDKSMQKHGGRLRSAVSFALKVSGCLRNSRQQTPLLGSNSPRQAVYFSHFTPGACRLSRLATPELRESSTACSADSLANCHQALLTPYPQPYVRLCRNHIMNHAVHGSCGSREPAGPRMKSASSWNHSRNFVRNQQYRHCCGPIPSGSLFRDYELADFIHGARRISLVVFASLLETKKSFAPFASKGVVFCFFSEIKRRRFLC